MKVQLMAQSESESISDLSPTKQRAKVRSNQCHSSSLKDKKETSLLQKSS